METQEPELDDCFEYKLVGVNVHSGSANMGHYWSYINTKRGVDETPGDNWLLTEQDPWMEFNDSNVSNFDFKDLKDKCFGNKSGGASKSYYASSIGDSYGQSGYMLFYERRKKKDLKILVSQDKIEEEKQKGFDIKHDSEKDEYFKMVPYRKSFEDEKPNDIYKKVFDDNKKFTFETDIYSEEFFTFILNIMKGIANLKDVGSDQSKLMGLQVGKKVGFEILARCMSNLPQIQRLSEVMIEIAKSSPETSAAFLDALLEDDDAEVVQKILFDCSDKTTQKHLGRVIKYMLCQLKVVEKDLIRQNKKITVDVEEEDALGNKVTRQVEKHESVSLRFFMTLLSQIYTRGARAWSKFDVYLEIILSFAIHSAEDIENDTDSYRSAPHDP